MALRIALLEDHPMMRDLLASAIVDILGAATEVVACQPADLLGSERPFDFNLAVVDLDLGTTTPTPAVIRHLVEAGVPTVSVSAGGTPLEVQEAMRAGSMAFVAKAPGLPQFAEVITAALDGRVHLTAELAGKLASPVIPDIALTNEQGRALALASTGMSRTAIAGSLGRTTGDVAALLESSITAYRGA